jgi:triosephosphate isomerase
MNGDVASAESFVTQLSTAHKVNAVKEGRKVVVCPPFTLLEVMVRTASLVELSRDFFSFGAQDCHYSNNNFGAFTGSISAGMLKSLSCDYVILGHSERRQYYLENEELIGKKITSALNAGLVPIICVGDSEEGGTTALLLDSLSKTVPKDLEASSIIVAYEPVWAIGTGKRPTSKQIDDVITSIKKWSLDHLQGKQVKVLYGGSVSGDVVSSLAYETAIDGLLVGGASLNFASFWDIVAK